MAHRPTERGAKCGWKLRGKDWEKIKDVFPVKVVGPKGGRPAADNRRVFEALIWFCREGCTWECMPVDFPSWSTCRRRLLEWESDGVLPSVHEHLLALLEKKGRLWMEAARCRGQCVLPHDTKNRVALPTLACCNLL